MLFYGVDRAAFTTGRRPRGRGENTTTPLYDIVIPSFPTPNSIRHESL